MGLPRNTYYGNGYGKGLTGKQELLLLLLTNLWRRVNWFEQKQREKVFFVQFISFCTQSI